MRYAQTYAQTLIGGGCQQSLFMSLWTSCLCKAASTGLIGLWRSDYFLFINGRKQTGEAVPVSC